MKQLFYQHETACFFGQFTCKLNTRPTLDFRVIFASSSMYFDEDGDLAHEFYEEVRPSKKGKKFFMKKVTRRLLPQGLVDLPHPRLHVDFPVVMCETCY